MEENKFETIALTKKDGIATVRLNRPEKRNAITPKMGKELIEAFEDIEKEENVKVIIITGTGEAFSAGGDVKEDIAPLSEMGPSEFNAYFGELVRMYTKVMEVEKPVIAAINGYTIGAGLDLAMSCDIRIASEKAKIGQFFVKMGLTPEVGPYLMPRLIGVGKAKLLSFTGDLITAKEAEEIGMVEKVVEEDELMSAAEELAEKLTKGATQAIGTIKRAINESLKMDIYSSLDYVTRLQYQLVHTSDHKEAVKAFLEKRKPLFRGK